jgi:hypothetical protein
MGNWCGFRRCGSLTQGNSAPCPIGANPSRVEQAFQKRTPPKGSRPASVGGIYQNPKNNDQSPLSRNQTQQSVYNSELQCTPSQYFPLYRTPPLAELVECVLKLSHYQRNNLKKVWRPHSLLAQSLHRLRARRGPARRKASEARHQQNDHGRGQEARYVPHAYSIKHARECASGDR